MKIVVAHASNRKLGPRLSPRRLRQESQMSTAIQRHETNENGSRASPSRPELKHGDPRGCNPPETELSSTPEKRCRAIRFGTEAQTPSIPRFLPNSALTGAVHERRILRRPHTASDLPTGLYHFHHWAAVESTYLQPPLVPAAIPATLAPPSPCPLGRQTTREDHLKCKRGLAYSNEGRTNAAVSPGGNNCMSPRHS